ncbi:MAG: MCE family protein [Marmoricola sp.]
MVVRKLNALVALVVGAVVLSGCSFGGVQSMQLPGGVGTGDGSLKVTVELPDVGTLTPNGQVKVGDVAVGTVTSIKAVDWHAVATISLDPKTELPANAIAKVGVNSLLGASYLELSAPTEEPATGQLISGTRIPLAHGEAYPATEQVLSAASVVLNGGGLEQLSTITSELSKAFTGNNLAVRDLLPRVNSFVTALDAQKEQIYGTIESLDRLSTRFARNRNTLTRSIDQIGPALATLSRERPKVTAALSSLKKLSDVATPLVRSTGADLVGNLRDLAPALRAIDSAGGALVNGLGFAVTFPFAPETMQNACRGDYCNLDLILDLTNNALVNGFLTKDGLPSLPGLPGLPTTEELLNLLGLGGQSPLGGLLGGLTSGLTGGTAKTPAAPSSSQPSVTVTQPPSSGNGLSGLLNGLLGGGR